MCREGILAKKRNKNVNAALTNCFIVSVIRTVSNTNMKYKTRLMIANQTETKSIVCILTGFLFATKVRVKWIIATEMRFITKIKLKRELRNKKMCLHCAVDCICNLFFFCKNKCYKTALRAVLLSHIYKTAVLTWLLLLLLLFIIFLCFALWLHSERVRLT